MSRTGGSFDPMAYDSLNTTMAFLPRCAIVARQERWKFTDLFHTSWRGRVACGLEELDGVAGGIVEHDLLAAGTTDHGAAEHHTGGAKALYFGVDVVDDQVDAVPSAGTGLTTVGH